MSHAAVKTALSLSLGKFISSPKNIERVAMVSDGLTSEATEMGDLNEAPHTRDGTCGYRSGITGADGKLTAHWRGLFERYSDRFLLGSDTWINGRWFGYDTIFREYRGWLAQLPLEHPRRVATGSARRLFDTAARN